MARKAKSGHDKLANNALAVRRTEDEDSGFATARAILGPNFRHAVTASQVLKPQFGSMDGAPGFGDYADAIGACGDDAAKGELAFVSRALAAQAMTLDTIFTESARRMALNMGEHLAAAEVYNRLAMKAQAQSRATFEALVKLHQPREQTVRHVHVSDGGQAVIADQFHHHTGASGNGDNEQSHTTGTAGSSPALLGFNSEGNGVPISGSEGPKTLSHARRHQSRSA